MTLFELLIVALPAAGLLVGCRVGYLHHGILGAIGGALAGCVMGFLIYFGLMAAVAPSVWIADRV